MPGCERDRTRAHAGGLTEPYRHELQLHCYRIVGSTKDAWDLVQETMLAAWRSPDQFMEHASIRTPRCERTRSGRSA